MSTDPRDEVRDLMARYPASPARTRAALAAAFRDEPPTEPGDVELAARMLSGLGITADEIREGLAEGGSISVMVLRDEDPGDG